MASPWYDTYFSQQHQLSRAATYRHLKSNKRSGRHRLRLHRSCDGQQRSPTNAELGLAVAVGLRLAQSHSCIQWPARPNMSLVGQAQTSGARAATRHPHPTLPAASAAWMVWTDNVADAQLPIHPSTFLARVRRPSSLTKRWMELGPDDHRNAAAIWRCQARAGAVSTSLWEDLKTLARSRNQKRNGRATRSRSLRFTAGTAASVMSKRIC